MGLIKSAHDISEGGIAVALSECCLAGKTGAMISLVDDIPNVPLLFSETQSRVILSTSPENLFLLERMTGKHRTSIEVIGKVGGDSLLIKKGSKTIVDIPVSKLSGAYYDSIEKAVEVR